MKKLPFRKNIRLKHYDYKQDGYYFVTVVTRNKLPLLKNFRKEIEEYIKLKLPKFIHGLTIDYFVVMDNHIHIIFILENCNKVLGQIVRAMKYGITKIIAAGLPSCNNNVAVRLPSHNVATVIKAIWQWNYFEHIIRNEKALSKIREYIQNNPDALKIRFEEFYKDRETGLINLFLTGDKVD